MTLCRMLIAKSYVFAIWTVGVQRILSNDFRTEISFEIWPIPRCSTSERYLWYFLIVSNTVLSHLWRCWCFLVTATQLISIFANYSAHSRQKPSQSIHNKSYPPLPPPLVGGGFLTRGGVMIWIDGFVDESVQFRPVSWLTVGPTDASKYECPSETPLIPLQLMKSISSHLADRQFLVRFSHHWTYQVSGRVLYMPQPLRKHIWVSV